MAGSSATDIELGRLNADPAYFQEVNELEVLLGNVANVLQKLKRTNQEFNSVTESAAMKEIKGCMEEDMDELGKMAHIMKEKFGRIVKNNVEIKKKPWYKKGTTIDRSRMSLTIALKTKLKERKSDPENLGKTIQQEYLEVIQKRTFTGAELAIWQVTGIKLSDEAIRVLDIGSIVQMFENALQGANPEQMVAAVDEIKERHAAATNFGRKILELQQNFDEMAALIETQEKIDKKKIDKALKKEVKNDVKDVRSTFQDLRQELEENGSDSDYCQCL